MRILTSMAVLVFLGVGILVALGINSILRQRPTLLDRYSTRTKRRRLAKTPVDNITSEQTKLLGTLMRNAHSKQHFLTAPSVYSKLHSDSYNLPQTYDTFFARVAINAIMTTYNLTREGADDAPSSLALVRRVGELGCYFTWRGIHILAFRGTVSKSDVITDLNFTQCRYESSATNRSDIYVHTGFYLGWQQHSDAVRSLVKEIADDQPDATFIITGHSMGAAIAALAVVDSSIARVRTGLYAFASPQVGNAPFYEEIVKRVSIYHSVENYRDVVTQLPPPVAPTFSTNYYYDHAPPQARVVYNFETGSLVGNHNLDAYSNAIENQPLPDGWLWNRGIDH